MMFGSASPEWAAPPEFDVTSSDDPGTDLEDELLRISPLPMIVSPLPEPDEALSVSPSLYPAPPVPAQPNPALTSGSRFVPLRVVDERPTIDLFPSYTMSLAYSYYDPTTSPVTSDVPDASEYLSPGSPAAVDRYLVEDGDLLLDDSSDLPLLPLPLLPLPADDVPSLEFAVTRSPGGQFPVSTAVSPDLSREGPFDASQTVSASWAAPPSLGQLTGIWTTTTSPTVLGIRRGARIGASAEAPSGYWLHHMDQEQAVSAALQLQHDAGLMMSNLQVLGQFVASLNRMSSEVLRLAFGQEQYPSVTSVSTCPAGGSLHGGDGVCGIRLVPRVLPGLCRPHPVMTACYVITAFRT